MKVDPSMPKKMGKLKTIPLATRYQMTMWTSATLKRIARSISGKTLHVRTAKLKRSLKARTHGSVTNPKAEIGSYGVVYARILEKGGKIRPKNKKYLTVPFPKVKGKAPNYSDTFVIKSKKGSLLIVQKKGKSGFKPLFTLRKEVKIPAFGWLSNPIHEALPQLHKLMNKAEILRVAGRLAGRE